jgi:hypothetical protein
MARTGPCGAAELCAGTAPRSGLSLQVIRDGGLRFQHRYIALIKIARSGRDGPTFITYQIIFAKAISG